MRNFKLLNFFTVFFFKFEGKFIDISPILLLRLIFRRRDPHSVFFINGFEEFQQSWSGGMFLILSERGNPIIPQPERIPW